MTRMQQTHYGSMSRYYFALILCALHPFRSPGSVTFFVLMQLKNSRGFNNPLVRRVDNQHDMKSGCPPKCLVYRPTFRIVSHRSTYSICFNMMFRLERGWSRSNKANVGKKCGYPRGKPVELRLFVMMPVLIEIYALQQMLNRVTPGLKCINWHNF